MNKELKKEYRFSAEDYDLEETMTCGQTFCWHRIEGRLYSDGKPHFYSFKGKEPIIVEQIENEIIVKTNLSSGKVKETLGLEDNLKEIFNTFPEHPELEKALENLWGLRVVQDDFFPCLISYICSSQMQIPRIKKMHDEIARKYGEKYKIDNKTLIRFPTLNEMAEATEEELRKMGIGYRAKYIVETVKILQERDDITEENLKEMEYEEARKKLKELYGVGDKVADCVLLFSLGFKEAIPLDTWADKIVQKYYSDLYADNYEQTSINLRRYFGDYAGYAQEYLFHAARKDIIKV